MLPAPAIHAQMTLPKARNREKQILSKKNIDIRRKIIYICLSTYRGVEQSGSSSGS